jgi:hypothetical protein
MLEEFRNKSLSECLELIHAKKMVWIVKRLTGNDTGLTGGHQVGVYFPKDFFRLALPEIHTTETRNPSITFKCALPINGADPVELRAIYYNNKYSTDPNTKGTRNEFRITGWGGKASPTQCDENTGSIFMFVVTRETGTLEALAIVAESTDDEALIEEWLGREVEPGLFFSSETHTPAVVPSDKFPEGWLTKFPSGEEIFAHVLQLRPWVTGHCTPDKLLLSRRQLEFEIFSKIEQAVILPQIKKGFESVEAYMAHALSVANRRKSRTGKSLELNLASIFMAEKINFDSQQVSENKKKPDFLFPSATEYRNQSFPIERLTMLASKTCCKDRWRQALSEADRIEKKHLFTLQEGVSSNQLEEMAAKQLTLVVPEPNLSSFPKDWRNRILSLSSFIGVVRERQNC